MSVFCASCAENLYTLKEAMMQSEKHPETGGKLKQMNPGVFQMNDMTTMDDGVGGITD